MPEGDTIFRSARVLDRALRGQTLTRFESVYPHLTRVDEDERLAGRVVEEVTAVGKHLLMRFSGGLILRTHMRMNGSWHLYRHGEAWQRGKNRARIVLETPHYVAVGFDVPEASFHREKDLPRSPVGRLGPDLLSESFDANEALCRLRAEGEGEREIGQALLDQRLVAGIGNEYKCEILFICRVNPFSRVDELKDDVLRAILEKARELLQRNVAEPMSVGRRTTRSADPRERLYVYGRGGKPCRRCGAAIAFRKQGPQARSTYYCPRCQPPR